ncbi:MAG: Asp-tRNA(Asn)/Glu-tRNA(Gln) amidotransferase subunit GatC [Parachlamydiales bacterium]|nr:Asp-tRNA(Asn)/Glu-tRNA(Gln) amidotransferase subunit GatC [Parachlamydiales bacterium]
MSEFDKAMLHNLEKLAMIKLSKEEEEEFSNRLKSIFDHVEQLKEVDTTNVKPCNFILHQMQKNVFRKDVEKDLLSHDKFLSNAPEKIAGLIKVPPILNHDQ